MHYLIRHMEEADRNYVMDMMRVFYASPAVLSNGSDEIFKADIDNCLNDNPYIEGYVFESDSDIIGYGMIAKSYSTEFGRPCIWFEDIYVKDEYRGVGIGSCFLKYIECRYPDCVFRLEVEDDNSPAINVYSSCGYEVIPYMEMKKQLSEA